MGFILVVEAAVPEVALSPLVTPSDCTYVNTFSYTWLIYSKHYCTVPGLVAVVVVMVLVGKWKLVSESKNNSALNGDYM